MVLRLSNVLIHHSLQTDILYCILSHYTCRTLNAQFTLLWGIHANILSAVAFGFTFKYHQVI